MSIKEIIQKIKSNKFKFVFALVTFAIGLHLHSFTFYFFAGYALGDITFSQND